MTERPSDEPGSSEGGLASPEESGGGATPLADGREPDPERALPRLSYEHLGMHIGGEPNTPQAKQPWLDDIERGADALLLCYRHVSDPVEGGSYGVDLYIGASGGAPEVRASRQKLGGSKLEECMTSAFESLSFHRPERPTMLSYSILFRLQE